MWSYIVGGVFLALAMYFIVQGIRCGAAVRESKNRFAAYNAQTAALSYGDITYVDSGEGEVILSVHGIFGGMTRLMTPVRTFAPTIGSSLPHGSDTWEATFSATERPPGRRWPMWSCWTSWALTRCTCWPHRQAAASRSDLPLIIPHARKAGFYTAPPCRLWRSRKNMPNMPDRLRSCAMITPCSC